MTSHTDFTTPGFSPPVSEGEAFFFEHAGWGYHPDRETPEEGRMRGARTLRAAEVYAQREGWHVDWEEDPDPITDDDVERDEDYSQYVAVLYDSEGNVLGSLGSIDLGSDTCMGYDARPHHFEGGPITGEPLRKVYDPYVRVVEAELASEALEDR